MLTQDAATLLLALHPWQNPIFALDVSGNGFIEPLDVLLVINHHNLRGSASLPVPPASPDGVYRVVDVTGNDYLEPLDILRIINYINRFGSGPVPTEAAEGEPNGDGFGATGIDRSLDFPASNSSVFDGNQSSHGGSFVAGVSHPGGPFTAEYSSDEPSLNGLRVDSEILQPDGEVCSEPALDGMENKQDWCELDEVLTAIADDVTQAWLG